MLALCQELCFAKQPIVERCSGVVIGYTGVDGSSSTAAAGWSGATESSPRLRAKGYATEASLALFEVARSDYAGEVLGITHPENGASQNVIRKLGFAYWKQAPVQGDLRNLFRLHV